MVVQVNEFFIRSNFEYQTMPYSSLEECMAALSAVEEDTIKKDPSFWGTYLEVIESEQIPLEELPFLPDSRIREKLHMFITFAKDENGVVGPDLVRLTEESFPTVFKISKVPMSTAGTVFVVNEIKESPANQFRPSSFSYIDTDGFLKVNLNVNNSLFEVNDSEFKQHLFVRDIHNLESNLRSFWAQHSAATKIATEKLESIFFKTMKSPQSFFKHFNLDLEELSLYKNPQHDSWVTDFYFSVFLNLEYLDEGMVSNRVSIRPEDEEEDNDLYIVSMKVNQNNNPLFAQPAAEISFPIGIPYISKEKISDHVKTFSVTDNSQYLFDVIFLVSRESLGPTSGSRIPFSLRQVQLELGSRLLHTINSLKQDLIVLEGSYSDGYVEQNYLD